MREVIMQYSGAGEDLHNLTRVGELVRCEDCKYNSNTSGNYANCDIIPQMFGRATDNYCSMGEKIHEED